MQTSNESQKCCFACLQVNIDFSLYLIKLQRFVQSCLTAVSTEPYSSLSLLVLLLSELFICPHYWSQHWCKWSGRRLPAVCLLVCACLSCQQPLTTALVNLFLFRKAYECSHEVHVNITNLLHTHAHTHTHARASSSVFTASGQI